MMNRSEENQNGCREQTRNEDEGIDGILEELMAHVCDELCRFREEMQRFDGQDMRTLRITTVY